MRILLFISLLCSIAFSAVPDDSLRLKGSKAWQTVTINHLAVGETTEHFLYQKKIPRTSAIAANVNSADDVGFTRVDDTIRIPRWVIFTTDTIYLYGDIAVSSTTDTSYRLQYGGALTEVNASATFTNSGIINFFGFDEASGTSTVDFATSNTASIVSPAELGATGVFWKAVTIGPSGRVNAGKLSFMSEKTTFCISSCLYIETPTPATERVMFQQAVNPSNKVVVSLTSVGNIVAVVANASVTYGYFNIVGLSAGWHNIVIDYNGGGLANADRLKIYLDSEQKTLTFSGTIPAQTVNLSTADFNFGISGFVGLTVDNFATYANSLVTRATSYNMLFNPSTFSTLGAVQLTSTTGSKWGGYKSAFKDAYKRAWK